jgi:hypothetical protein
MGVSCIEKIKTNTASVLGRSSMVQFKMYLGRKLNEQKKLIFGYVVVLLINYIVHPKLIL